MKFETANQAALRMGCTVRAVQKWAKEGKFPYAHKVGNSWMIPVNAVRPSGTAAMPTMHINEPFPFLLPYQPGAFHETLSRLHNEDDRSLALCGYHYMIGELKESTILAEPYLDHPYPVIRVNAAVFCAFANLCRGHLNKTHYAAEILQQTMEAGLRDGAPPEVNAANVLSAMIVKMQLHLPVENVPSLQGYVKYLPEGCRLFACYLMAYRAYLEKNYAKSLGIVEAALSFDA